MMNELGVRGMNPLPDCRPSIDRYSHLKASEGRDMGRLIQINAESLGGSILRMCDFGLPAAY